MGSVQEVTDAEFDSEVLQADIPVLVDFWAPWCGPCRMIGPVVEQLAGEFAGRALIGKLNVDENRQTAGKLGIRGIPTVIIFRNGKIAEQFVGVKPKPIYAKALKRLL